jgi:hypothetical protein
MTTYQHTQFGSAIVWPLILTIVISCVLAFVAPVMRAALLIAVPLVLVLFFFWKLTITIDDKSLRAAFGPGFIYKQIPLSQIESAIPVRIKWWEGWGIHLSRFGWLYNVSGLDAVAIRLRDGKQLALGTDQPDELTAAIRRLASAK